MDQLHIAICDDEMLDLSQVMELVNLYNNNNQLQITTFLHAVDLLNASNKDKFDIVLLDIEMEPPSGFDVAKELIETDYPPTIIFTTKSNAYALKGYGIAIRYLQKPLSYDSLSEALDVAIADATAHRLTIQVESVLHTVRLRDVQYIEIYGHYANIHTAQQTFRLRTTLKEILKRLPKGYFVPTHKSFIVNLDHLTSATTSEIKLDCGAIIPIGRTKAKEFNQALFRFLGR